MATHDAAFWIDSGRGSLIHNMFRTAQGRLTGLIQKPTGVRDGCVVLEQSYSTASSWRGMSDALLKGGRYLLIAI